MARTISKQAKVVIVVLCLVLLLAAGLLIYRWYEAADRQTDAARAGSASPLDISAQDLAAAYDQDPVEADTRYSDRILRVSGRVHSISAGQGGPVIVMGGDDPLLTVTASFDRTQVDRIAAMTLDSEATVVCSRATLMLESPALQDCRFAD